LLLINFFEFNYSVLEECKKRKESIVGTGNNGKGSRKIAGRMEKKRIYCSN
jgi:hypothetical protein